MSKLIEVIAYVYIMHVQGEVIKTPTSRKLINKEVRASAKI
jgi:hypothetical protein